MSKPLLPDELWAVVEPLLPPEPPKPKGGRPRVPDRAALTGILFVLRSGTPWELLPQEMGCGSGMTCWRRLRDWQRAGVWIASSACSSTAWGGATPSTSAGLLSTAPLWRPKGGLSDRSQPNRSRQGRHQAACPHRCTRHPSRSHADGSQRPRQQDAGRGGRCHSAHPAILGTASTKTWQAPRRQSLRPSPLPSRPGPPPHPSSHRPPRR